MAIVLGGAKRSSHRAVAQDSGHRRQIYSGTASARGGLCPDGKTERSGRGTREGSVLVAFLDRFFLSSRLGINLLEHSPCRSKFGVDVQNLAQLLDGLIASPRQVQLPSQCSVNDQRERVQLLRPFCFSEAFLRTPHVGQIISVPMVCSG